MSDEERYRRILAEGTRVSVANPDWEGATQLGFDVDGEAEFLCHGLASEVLSQLVNAGCVRVLRDSRNAVCDHSIRVHIRRSDVIDGRCDVEVVDRAIKEALEKGVSDRIFPEFSGMLSGTALRQAVVVPGHLFRKFRPSGGSALERGVEEASDLRRLLSSSASAAFLDSVRSAGEVPDEDFGETPDLVD